eukprot:SAG11_NODE_4534_length_1862_cov_1.181509_1_plen_42_part_10
MACLFVPLVPTTLGACDASKDCPFHHFVTVDRAGLWRLAVCV